MRVEQNPMAAGELFNKIRSSELFDRKLKMYKVNACLDSESEMIGRTRIFPRGWLENESIWLHMEYKYLLELLRQGLYEKFFMSFKQVLIPFQPPDRYGRSTLENSSFLVSSAHSDKSLHGQGFVARLSGSTAEFVQIWAWMGAGLQPFCHDQKRGLSLIFKPILPGWLFTRRGSVVEYVNPGGTRQTIEFPANIYAFMFLGKVLVVYHNPKRKNTFDGLASQEITLTYLSGKVQKVNGAEIPMPYSQDVRERKVERIDVFLA